MQDLNAQLRDAGLKATPARAAVLAFLKNSNQPHSAIEILAHLKKRKIDQATLYRILDIFFEKGLVKKIGFQDGRTHYEINGDNHHHHVICTSCRKVEDVSLPKGLERQENKIARQTKFKILNHSFEFFGLCPECK